MDHIDYKDPKVLKQKLNLDTAVINWNLLASYQKEEAIIQVDAALDLIEVATEFVLDNSAQVSQWLESKQITKVDNETAEAWQRSQQSLWAVVVAPWVLVQLPKTQTN